MKRFVKFTVVAIFASFLLSAVAEGRGGGPGGGGRGGGGGGGGGRGGWGGGGGRGGWGGGGGRWGGPGGWGGAGGGRWGAGRFTGGTGGKQGGQETLAEEEDRRNLIAERRKRLMEADRVANQELRLAAARVEAAGLRVADDVR